MSLRDLSRQRAKLLPFQGPSSCSIISHIVAFLIGGILVNVTKFDYQSINLSLKDDLLPASAPSFSTIKAEEIPKRDDVLNIMNIISATSFPMDSKSGKIKFPQSITTLVVDIGARASDYLGVLEKYEDSSVALILVDPLPDSSIPLMKRVAEYSMRGYTGGESYLDPAKSRQVFLVRAAVGKTEGIANLNIAAAPACTSILNTSAKNDFWCANSGEAIKVPIITLDGLLGLLPDNISIKQIHVKIDTEGADLDVLKGAPETLPKIDTIIIECNSDRSNRTFRDDECMASQAIKYMAERGFNTSVVEGQGDLVNIFFARNNYYGPLPDYLLRNGIAHRKFYSNFASSGTYLKVQP
ncbi:hypothetical protein HJC23_007366 [Cyclotella cryptica]|uniref:Methyltransferase FkbM domain-containing protein n=1 Tax=Cyclotella cryptica TaxID=29204 RepID=A0ABD3Q4I2_9STRA|eukprot:CCRYP_008679-RA/>CCRYP_008679-RA protein AED:0.27 eAED:0.27 QI:0/-1/0/1/-1/1/1/0/354